MTTNRTTNVLLAVIAVGVTVIAARPYSEPVPVQAQAGNADAFYVEPGTYALRIPNTGSVQGKVAINMRTGNVFGFPTGGSDPYPLSPLGDKLPVSRPILLGRFGLSEASRY